jgi:predicted alpha/beta-fold hydrolase
MAEHFIEDENLKEKQRRDRSIGHHPHSSGPVDPELVQAFITDFARELGDEASVDASTARAVALWRESGASEPEFLAALREARTRTQRFTGLITKQRGDGNGKNKMPYFFTVLKRLLNDRG